MQRYTILFIVTLVVVSGFIAYIGDFLGRKMGKKRLTMFGLRPRHTAIVVTTITGMVIAVLTLATIIGVSSSIREVLVAGERKIKENKLLTEQNKTLRHTNVKLQEKEQVFRRDFENAQADVKKASQARDAAARRVDDLTKLIETNIRELNDLKNKKGVTEEQLKEKISKLALLQGDLKSSQRKLAETDRSLDKSTKLLFEAGKDVLAQNKLIEDQKRAIELYNKQIADQGERIQDLGKENLELGSKTGKFMFRNVILKQGEELARRVVSQNQIEPAIGADIIAVLEEASEKAQGSGAANGKNDRSVLVVKPGTKWTEMECINNAAAAIKGGSAPVVVQVIAFSNTVAGEQTLVQLNLFPNELAFAKGAKLASASIDGRQREGKILVSVVNFLRRDVRKAADAAGVVPVASSEPEIQGDQLDELLDLVGKIKQLDSVVQLRVTAERDIYAAGPLNLNNMEFSISTVTARAYGR